MKKFEKDIKKVTAEIQELIKEDVGYGQTLRK